jgi:microcystin degradation protein MlrC
MRVFTASLATETNTFAPLPTGLAAFHEAGYFPAGQHPDRMTFFAGPLWAARQRAREQGWTLIEGLVTGAQPGGTTTRHAYETLRDTLLADLRAALPVDLVLLGLHGAMVADGYDDCEGDLLARVRAIVGSGVVVGAELDPHNHLSAAMVSQADLLIAFKQYPHTDVLERAFELVDLCAAQVAGTVQPLAAVADCGMVAILHTTREPARGFVHRLQALEGHDGVLSISISHGFPWGDVADMGTRVLVYTDARQSGAQANGDRLALRLAAELVALREQLDTPWLDIDAALDTALAAPPGLVVIADSADNPGGGAAGDSTFILRRLIARGFTNAALGPLWDPQAVRIAFDAGLGACLPLRLGGKVSPMSGDPIDLACRVKALVPAMTMSGLAGTLVALGDCALVEAQGVEIVLISQRSQAMGTDVFTGLGCDLVHKRVVVVKSSQHFRAAFESLAALILYASAPGSVSSDLRSLPYIKVARPKWPLDAAGPQIALHKP